jgi:hypothetical protein
MTLTINVREHRRGNKNNGHSGKKTWQHWVHKTQHEDKQNKAKKHHYAQTNTNNVYKTSLP